MKQVSIGALLARGDITYQKVQKGEDDHALNHGSKERDQASDVPEVVEHDDGGEWREP